MQQHIIHPLHSSDLLYWVETDITGLITQANHRFCQKFAYIADDLIGYPILKTVAAADTQLCVDTVKQCFIHPNKPIPVTLRKPKENGGYYLGHWEFTFVQNEAENLAKMVCIGFDITESEAAKQEREELTIHLKSLENLFKYLPLGIVLVSHSGELLEANRTFTEIIGVEHLEMGTNLFKLLGILPEQLTLIPNNHAPVELTIAQANERNKHCMVYGSLFTDSSNQQKSWYVFQDITERVVLKKVLNEKLHLLNNTGEVAKIGGWQFEALANRLTWTEHTYQIHEVDEHTFKPDVETAIHFYKSEYRAEITHLLQRCIQFEEPFNVIAQLVTFKGNLIWVRAIGQPLYDANQNVIGATGIVQDITEQEITQQKVLEQNKLLKEIALMQSHVMRHPVSNILGLVHLITDEELQLQEVKQLLAYLTNEANKLDHIIKNLVARANQQY